MPKPRCPNGTRRNPKTGECESKSKSKSIKKIKKVKIIKKTKKANNIKKNNHNSIQVKHHENMRKELLNKSKVYHEYKKTQLLKKNKAKLIKSSNLKKTIKELKKIESDKPVKMNMEENNMGSPKKREAKYFYRDDFTNNILPDNPNDKLIKLEREGWKSRKEFESLFNKRVKKARKKFDMKEGDLFYSGGSGRPQYNVYMVTKEGAYSFGEDLYNKNEESQVLLELNKLNDKVSYVHMIRDRVWNGLADMFPMWESDVYPNGLTDLQFKKLTIDEFEKKIVLLDVNIYKKTGPKKSDFNMVNSRKFRELYDHWDSANSLKEKLKNMGCNKLSGGKEALKKKIKKCAIEKKIFRKEIEAIWNKEGLYAVQLSYEEQKALKNN